MTLAFSKHILYSAIILCFICFPGYGQKTADRTKAPDGTVAELERHLEKLESEGFAGVFLLAKNGEILLRKGFGSADRKKNRPNTPETGFDIGSITKVFTAAAIYKLAEQNKLHPTDKISRFFRGVPPDKAEITVEQLVTHTSGLPDVVDEKAAEINYTIGFDYTPVTKEEIIRRALRATLKFAPGEKRRYSNLGYSLLGALIEAASGKSYEEYLRAEIFEPAGMTRTGYLGPDWHKKDLAVGYRKDEAWGTPLDHRWLADGPSWNLRANGGMISNADDLYLWIKALEGDRILADKTKKAYFDAMRIGPNRRGTRTMGVAGSNGIFNAVYLWYLDEDRILIGLSNVAGRAAEDYAGKIAGLMLRAGL